jgi:putative membrane protein
MFRQGLFAKIIVNFIGFYLASWLFDGFVIDHWVSALIAAAVLIVVNLTIGVILKIVSVPFIILTVGLFIFVVNAVCLIIVDWFVPGIHFEGLLPALGTAVILAVANAVLVKKN